MAENRAIGRVAEWFKAAVLKTPKPYRSKPAKLPHFRHSVRRNGRFVTRLARGKPPHWSAQFVLEMFNG